MTDLVSVVIPTFKRCELLKRAVASALAQDHANLEILVVGDCCPVLDASDFTDPRVHVTNLSVNHGSGGAYPRNEAIRLAFGDLIAYLDDDNAWLPDHLSSLLEAKKAALASYAFSSMSVDGKDLGFTKPERGGIDTSCVLHDKGLVDRYGGWLDRVAGGYAHDWEFFSRWVMGGEKWACTKKPTVIYNADTCGQPAFIRSMAAMAEVERNRKRKRLIGKAAGGTL